ncbi:MAG: hypothetical protein IT580_11175 [Verrucomicrobiales bacterium]|nr:hypothetical protein [Verrucomicrobiales bacterium]
MRRPLGVVVRSGWVRGRIARASWSWVGLVLALVMAMEARSAGAEASGRESDNIAFRLLQMEAEVVPASEPVRRELRETLEEAVAEVRRHRRVPPQHGIAEPSTEVWRREEVIVALRSIDDVLGRRGFLHPVDDRVDLLSEGLTPRSLSPTERDAVMKLSRNGRRAALVEARFPGPFRFVDCDTATAVYLGVAERLGLALQMVYSPSRNRQRGHVWVRWGKGARRVDWETTEGTLRSGFEWSADPGRGRPASRPGRTGVELELGREQVVGAWHYLLAVQHERRGEVEAMLRQLELALAAFPDHLDARRQLAWSLATLPDVTAERVRTAVAHAREVVKRTGDADSRDTLAAALAAHGDFPRAIREERAALADQEAPEAARAGYRRRLALYESGRAYQQPGRRHSTASGAMDSP